MKVFINNIETEVFNIDIDDKINGRSTSHFIVKDENAEHRFNQGAIVEIKSDDGTLLHFAGYIDTSTETLLGDSTKKYKRHSIYCKDNIYLADKRLIADSYLNTTCGDIVRDIITNYLSVEGVWEDTILNGELMEEVVFNYINIRQALDKLAEASGFIWFIDFEKGLHFKTRTSDTNSNDFLESHARDEGMTLEIGNQDYRNYQYIKGGKDLTDNLTESFAGDGVSKSFLLAFSCGEKPVIKVDGTLISSADIGIRGIDENKKWYWQKDNNVISQDEDNLISPVVEPGIPIQVQYRGLYDVVVAIFDQEQIDIRKDTEQNSGIIENIANELDNNSLLVSINSANAKLTKYATDGKYLKVITQRNDLRCGQTIRVNIPKLDLNEDMLIQKKRLRIIEDIVFWDVTFISGPEQDDFYQTIKKESKEGTRVIRENIDELKALIKSFTQSKTWLETDSKNIFKDAICGQITCGEFNCCFEPEHKVSHMVMQVLSGGTIYIRIDKVKQVIENGKITTTFIIKNNVSNGTIMSAKIYGGMAENVLIDTVDFIQSKNILEIFVITRTDTKGW